MSISTAQMHDSAFAQNLQIEFLRFQTFVCKVPREEVSASLVDGHDPKMSRAWSSVFDILIPFVSV